jgi:glycerol-3-phosphate acyltransferase PlsX
LLRIRPAAAELHRFRRGRGIGKGAADVIVTEGFSGNISIKVAEGTARQMTEFLRSAMARTWRSKIGYLFQKCVQGAERQAGPEQVHGCFPDSTASWSKATATPPRRFYLRHRCWL